MLGDYLYSYDSTGWVELELIGFSGNTRRPTKGIGGGQALIGIRKSTHEGGDLTWFIMTRWLNLNHAAPGAKVRKAQVR